MVASDDEIRLSGREIARLVKLFIGVSGGYLGDFSYRSHEEFYVECDVEVDPWPQDGTTRERFIEILRTRDSLDQAKILRGLLERFSDDEGQDVPAQRSQVRGEVLQWIQRLESGSPVVALVPVSTREVVVRALKDAEQLLKTTGAVSGVDRVHTALHGHLLALCEEASIPVDGGASTVAILKRLRAEHPALEDLGPRGGDIAKVLNAAGAMLDALGPVRNMASVAHPTDALLDEPEAMLVLNAGRTLLNYLDAKLRAVPASGLGLLSAVKS